MKFPMHIVAGSRALIAAAALLCSTGPLRGQSTIPEAAGNPFNVHLVAREDWLNRLVGRQETKPGVVDDHVLGAKVSGQQWTTTQFRVDLRPSADRAMAAVVLDGFVQSDTAGATEQATVYSRILLNFQATKELFFDGQNISTKHATIRTRAHNQTLGASTGFDATPLQPVATRITMKLAERRRPAAEEIARNRLADRVYPVFDGQVDRQLASANDQLETVVRARLREANLLPTAQLCRTTETDLHYAAQMAVGETAPAVLPPGEPLLSTQGVRLYVHASLLNGLLDRLNLAGRSMTDRELKLLLERVIPSRDRSERSGFPAGLETHIDFADRRPLSVLLDNDELVLELRATFRPAGQALLPPLLVSLPYRLVEQSGEWVLQPGRVGVVAQPTNGMPNTFPAPAEALIRQALTAQLKDVQIPRELIIPEWPDGKPLPQLTAVRAKDGWLAVGID